MLPMCCLIFRTFLSLLLLLPLLQGDGDEELLDDDEDEDIDYEVSAAVLQLQLVAGCQQTSHLLFCCPCIDAATLYHARLLVEDIQSCKKEWHSRVGTLISLSS
jgi:hypothetical protein